MTPVLDSVDGKKIDVCDRDLNVQLYQIRGLCIYHSHFWECIFNSNNQSIKWTELKSSLFLPYLSIQNTFAAAWIVLENIFIQLVVWIRSLVFLLITKCPFLLKNVTTSPLMTLNLTVGWLLSLHYSMASISITTVTILEGIGGK